MRTGLEPLIGEHDFSAFRGQGCTATTTVRTILRAGLAIPSSAHCIVTVVGNGFLRHMVRNIVGTLVEAGTGKRNNFV